MTTDPKTEEQLMDELEQQGLGVIPIDESETFEDGAYRAAVQEWNTLVLLSGGKPLPLERAVKFFADAMAKRSAEQETKQ